jgi:hypothetical protein
VTQPHRGVGKGPLEGGVAALRTGGAVALPGRCLGPLDQAARRDHIRPPEKTADVLECIENPAGPELPHPWDGLEPGAGSGLIRGGALDDRPLQTAQQLVVVGDQRQVTCDALVYGRVGQARGHAIAGGSVGAVLAELGQVLRAVGQLAISQELGTLAYQMAAAPTQVAGGPHGARIDRGVGEHAPATQRRHRL